MRLGMMVALTAMVLTGCAHGAPTAVVSVPSALAAQSAPGAFTQVLNSEWERYSPLNDRLTAWAKAQHLAFPMQPGNMVREVREETGLDISGVRRGERHYALSTERGTVIFRRYFLDEQADRVAARIRDFIAGESEPEIEEPVVIRDALDLPRGLMPHMPPLIDWHFSSNSNRP